MATHSSTLAWKIPWTEEPGGLQSMGLRRVRHDSATSLSLFTFLHWRRKWHSTPVLLPGESQGQQSLVGCCLWGLTESHTTDATQQQQKHGSSIFDVLSQLHTVFCSGCSSSYSHLLCLMVSFSSTSLPMLTWFSFLFVFILGGSFNNTLLTVTR